ncbi:MAG: hypothetical protein ACOCZV_00070 [Nanoarchaeota archaeon]
MELSLILSIILVVIVFVLGIKLFHSLVKAFITAIILVLILGVVGGVIVVNDATSFKEQFTEEKTTYVLTEDDGIITGFKATALNFSSFEPVRRDDLPSVPDNASEGNITIFIERSALIITDISDDNMTVDVAELIDSDDQSMQARGFMMAVTTTLLHEGPSFFFNNIEDDNVTIAPQRPTLTMLKYTPERLWSKAEEEFKVRKEQFTGDNASPDNLTDGNVSLKNMNLTS